MFISRAVRPRAVHEAAKLIVLVASIGLGVIGAAAQAASPSTSPWAKGHYSETRLVLGRAIAGGPERLIGIEIRMPPGWKTYWRNPGDAGGVPPVFDWSRSVNLAAAEVRLPAPARLQDASGVSLGYKERAVFPVVLTPADASKPIALALTMEFGVCREICIPAEAKLELAVPAGLPEQAPADLEAALARVPRPATEAKPGDPRLETAQAQLAGDRPRLVFEVAHRTDADGADVFIEAPDGLFVPLPAAVRPAPGARTTRHEVDLSSGVEVRELLGETLRLTIVSAAGASETTWQVPRQP